MDSYKRPKQYKKKGFPIGFFFIILIVLTIIVGGALGWYFYFFAKKQITEIEAYTKNYSKTMANTFAKAAEIDVKRNNYVSLRALFQQKMEQNTVDEAFFVLLDGKLLAHSDTKIAKSLRGYLSNDEFKYNLDYIHLYTKQKKREVNFLDYYIDSTEKLFNRNETFYLKKYIYKDMNKYHWLVTKAVFKKGKPYGTVAFIISRNRIFTFLKQHIAECKLYAEYAGYGVLALAFILSLLIFIRYRHIQKTAHASGKADAEIFYKQQQLEKKQKDKKKKQEQPVAVPIIEETKDQIAAKQQTESVIVSKKKKQPTNDYIKIELLGTIDDREIENLVQKQRDSIAKKQQGEQMNIFDGDFDFTKAGDSEIKDAIPVKKASV